MPKLSGVASGNVPGTYRDDVRSALGNSPAATALGLETELTHNSSSRYLKTIDVGSLGRAALTASWMV